MKLVKFEQYLDKKDIVNLAQASRTIYRDFKVLASQFVLVLLKDENAKLYEKFFEMKEQRDMALRPLARYVRDLYRIEKPIDLLIFNELKLDSRNVQRIANDHANSGYIRLGLNMDPPEGESSQSEDE